MNRIILAAVTLGLTSAASAASLWGSVNLTTQTFGVSAGLALLPVPLVGSFGVEAHAERPHGTNDTVLSLGATLRDVNLPLTDTNVYASAGVTFVNPAALYLEGGLRTPLLGPVGLKVAARAYPQLQQYRLGFGAELRF